MFRPIGSTNPTWYTIVHRRKDDASRRPYRCGLRSMDLNIIHEMAEAECRSGKFSYVKIVNSDTNKDVEKLMVGGKRV